MVECFSIWLDSTYCVVIFLLGGRLKMNSGRLMVLIISGWSPVLISFASYYCGCLVWVNRAGERGGEATFFLLIYKTLVDYRYTAIRKIGFWCGSWVEDKDDEILGAWNMKNLWLNTRIWTNTLSVKVHGQRNKGMMGSPSKRGRGTLLDYLVGGLWLVMNIWDGRSWFLECVHPVESTIAFWVESIESIDSFFRAWI